MAKKKGQTKKERLAKARAQAKKFTLSDGTDLYALLGPEINQVLAGNTNMVGLTEAIKYKTGYDLDSKTWIGRRLYHGWGGSVNHYFENKLFKLARVQGPHSEIKSVGDAMDWAFYFGKAALDGWEVKDDSVALNRAIYLQLNGVDLSQPNELAYQPGEMLYHKTLPYIVQKKVRQIPFIKKMFAKINKAF